MSSTRSLLQQKQSIDLDSEATVILFREKSASVAVKTVQSACDLPLSVHCWGWLNPRPNGRFSSAEYSISADRRKSQPVSNLSSVSHFASSFWTLDKADIWITRKCPRETNQRVLPRGGDIECTRGRGLWRPRRPPRPSCASSLLLRPSLACRRRRWPPDGFLPRRTSTMDTATESIRRCYRET